MIGVTDSEESELLDIVLTVYAVRLIGLVCMECNSSHVIVI